MSDKKHAPLCEAAQNALITLDGIASANPRDKADFETPDEWITWAKSRARWAADALRAPVSQEICAERILKQMLDEAQATQEPAQAQQPAGNVVMDAERLDWLLSQHWVEPEAKFRLNLEDSDDSAKYKRDAIAAIDAARQREGRDDNAIDD